MDSLAIPVLVTRVIALLALAGAVALMVTNRRTSDEGEFSFKDVNAYSFVVAAGVIEFSYSLLQLPFAIFYPATGKRMIKNGCFSVFDFYGDKIMSWFLATAVGAGIAATHDLKKQLVVLISLIGTSDDYKSKLNEFHNTRYISTGVLAVGFLCLAILPILSCFARIQPHQETDSFDETTVFSKRNMTFICSFRC